MKFFGTGLILFATTLFAMGAGAANEVSGQVQIKEDFKSRLTPKGVLYVFVRSAGASKGPPLAVKRIPAPNFPVQFSLGPQDSMMAGTEFKGPFKVVARFSPTGDALAKSGSLEGEIPADVGAKDLKITLDKLIP